MGEERAQRLQGKGWFEGAGETASYTSVPGLPKRHDYIKGSQVHSFACCQHLPDILLVFG